MMSSDQLSVLNFGDLNIPVYGTEQDPLIKCSDLIIHVLGYKKCAYAFWYKQMSITERQCYIQEVGETPTFNEQGIYWALLKSNRPIAHQFQFAVCNYLKTLRQRQLQHMEYTQKQLEDARLQIEELKRPNPASIYKFIVDGKCVYIGKDTSKAQDRPQQHMSQRLKIISQYSYIDTYLATQHVQNISWQVMPTDSDTVHDLEQEMIEQQKPKYNQQFNDQNVYQCKQCDAVYKKRAYFEKHMQRHAE